MLSLDVVGPVVWRLLQPAAVRGPGRGGHLSTKDLDGQLEVPVRSFESSSRLVRREASGDQDVEVGGLRAAHG